MTSLLSIGFDDAEESVYTNAFPIMEEYGLSGTVYVITNRIGGEGYMTRDMLIDIAESGWELGAHTHTHPKLKTKSYQKVKKEFSNSKEIVREILDSANTSQSNIGIAYPYGKDDAVGIREALLSEEIFKYGRINSNRKSDGEQVIETTVNKTPFTRSFLRARNPFKKGYEDFITNYENINNGWLIIYFHGISECDYPNISEFKNICKHIAKGNQEGEITVKNAIDVVNEYPDQFRTLFSEDRSGYVCSAEKENNESSLTGLLHRYFPK